MVCKRKYYRKSEELESGKNIVTGLLVKFLLYSFLTIVFVFLYCDMELKIIGEAGLAVTFICFIYEFLADRKGLGNVLEFLGRHSMNIFLFHTMIYCYYFPQYIFNLKYPILILAATVAAACAVSVIVERMKRWMKYYQMVEILLGRISFNGEESAKFQS